MSEYVGYWLECHNQNCSFPIRVPYSGDLDKKYERALPALFLFACPVCLRVNKYGMRDLRNVQFRSPDPYKAGKLALYSVYFGCAQPRCRTEIAVFTVGAAKVSISSLLQLWKSWNVDVRCLGKHRLRVPDPRKWWIQEEKALAGASQPKV